MHVNDLYEAWRLGVLQLTEDLEEDAERKAQVYEKADKFFAILGSATLSDILAELDPDGPRS